MARYQPHDKFFHRARARGLPSRAAFKLEELLARYRLLPPDARVVDLGCAPGGWLAVLHAALDGRGRIVGVDRVSCAAPGPHVIIIAGDLRAGEVQAAVMDALGDRADLITSDLAPKLSGIRERDQAQSRELIEASLALAARALRPGGAMLAKVFMGAEFPEVRRLFAVHFSRIDVVRTRASRPGSAELYLIARGFRGAGPEVAAASPSAAMATRSQRDD
ncbi:MAG TPA: RlmE family RNA methyltransferase [Candidatus Binataceae bacterium]|jgi:23S rRNA (uridine2552-2'-O)-methyltransferase|nr:RlmE family RNA methyltransferase [Candidatus Binataceae bacterium]